MALPEQTFTIPKGELDVSKEEQFINVITFGVESALSTIDRNYGPDAQPENQLVYHTRYHTEQVMARTVAILQAIHQIDGNLVSQRDILLGKFAAAWHDVIQLSTMEKVEGHVQKRERAIGESEKRSADLAEKYMRDANAQVGNIFTQHDMQVVREAILLTIPTFERDTVTHPEFGKYENNLIAQALTLADLGGPGMEGFATAKWESDALFVELNPDFAVYKKAYNSDHERRFASTQETEVEKEFTRRMIIWLKSQVVFNHSQYEIVKEEIATMKPHIQAAVLQLFSNYPDVFEGMNKFLALRKQINFFDWLDELNKTLANPPVG